MTGMTGPVRKLSISLPGDVAARLDQEDNVSAFVADTIRARMRSEQVNALLRERGVVPTADGVARAAAARAAVEAEWPAERFEQTRQRIRQAAADLFADPPARHAPAA